MPFSRDPCKMTAEALELMTEKTGSNHGRNKMPEKAGEKFCLKSKTKFLTDQSTKIFNAAPIVKYRNRLM